MQLNIRLFFSLYREGVKQEARQYREMLRISVAPKMNLKYFDMLSEIYEKIIDPDKSSLPSHRPGPCLEMGTLEARHVLQSVMTNFKRNSGYV